MPCAGFYSANTHSEYPASLLLDGQSFQSESPKRKACFQPCRAASPWLLAAADKTARLALLLGNDLAWT